MPRFFFDIHDGRSAPDGEGTELSNLAEAGRAAVVLAGRLLLDDPAGFWQREHWSIEVKDHTGLVLFILHLDAVLAPILKSGRSMLDDRTRCG